MDNVRNSPEFTSRSILLTLFAFFSSILISTIACIFQADSTPIILPTTPATSTNPPPISYASLPYTYTDGDLQITILEVTLTTEEHGAFIPEGYTQWTVNFMFENLLVTDYHPPDRGWPIGACAGFSFFKLKTDNGYVYEPRFSGGSLLCNSLKPKATRVAEELYIFEIGSDEIPVELWGYQTRPNNTDPPEFIFEVSN